VFDMRTFYVARKLLASELNVLYWIKTENLWKESKTKIDQ